VSALAGAQRPIITLAVAAVTFVLVYRLSTLVARSRGQRYYRHILILYQATGSRGGNAGWLWQVTLAPTITTLKSLRVSAVAWLIRRRRWINRNVLGLQSGIANQDLVRVRLGGIISAAVVGVASNGNLASTAAGALLGVVVFLLLARRHNHRRHLLFAQQLPRVLSVMINAIRAGRSLGQTIDVIAEQVAEPARSEFLLVAQRRRLGGDRSEGARQVDRLGGSSPSGGKLSTTSTLGARTTAWRASLARKAAAPAVRAVASWIASGVRSPRGTLIIDILLGVHTAWSL